MLKSGSSSPEDIFFAPSQKACQQSSYMSISPAIFSDSTLADTRSPPESVDVEGVVGTDAGTEQEQTMDSFAAGLIVDADESDVSPVYE
jgi:hypothetical protein